MNIRLNGKVTFSVILIMEMVQTVFYTSSSEKSWSLKAYDTNTAACLFKYCGESGADGARILLVANGCILEAQKGRAQINVWPLNKYNYDTKARIFTKDIIDSFASTTTQKVLAYSINETVYLYKSESGQVEIINTCHYLTVNVIKFSGDDCFVASGGDDGMVLVWNVDEILGADGNKEPLHKFANHILPVTDIGFTALYDRLRLVSVSEDRTAKIYDLIEGAMFSLVFETELQCVALPNTNLSMIIGGANGRITEIPYGRLSNNRKSNVEDIIRPSDRFFGHSKSVTCLDVTRDTLFLVSGSKDATVRVWDTFTHLCLHILRDSLPVNSVVVINLPNNVFRLDYKPNYYFHPISSDGNLFESLIELDIASQNFVEIVDKKDLEHFLNDGNDVEPDGLVDIDLES